MTGMGNIAVMLLKKYLTVKFVEHFQKKGHLKHCETLISPCLLSPTHRHHTLQMVLFFFQSLKSLQMKTYF